MRVLVIGDVVGKPGRNAIGELVPHLREELRLDLVIANGENGAGGFGVTPETAHELFDNEVDVITSGNHIWKHKEIVPFINEEWPLIRPANYPEGTPGRGYIILGETMIINLMGRVFMEPLECPFKMADQILNGVKGANEPKIIIVDFHAEATSEKQALGWYLDGRVSAVVGTHTHVGTADARVLPRGTAYISDIGMCGPRDSVIGSDIGAVLDRFLTQMPQRLTVPNGPAILNSVLLDIDGNTGGATHIERIDRMVD